MPRGSRIRGVSLGRDVAQQKVVAKEPAGAVLVMRTDRADVETLVAHRRDRRSDEWSDWADLIRSFAVGCAAFALFGILLWPRAAKVLAYILGLPLAGLLVILLAVIIVLVASTIISWTHGGPRQKKEDAHARRGRNGWGLLAGSGARTEGPYHYLCARPRERPPIGPGFRKYTFPEGQPTGCGAGRAPSLSRMPGPFLPYSVRDPEALTHSTAPPDLTGNRHALWLLSTGGRMRTWV